MVLIIPELESGMVMRRTWSFLRNDHVGELSILTFMRLRPVRCRFRALFVATAIA